MLSTKEWNKILDTYLIEGKMDMEDYNSLDDTQKLIINEIKKSINRIKNK